MSEQLVSRDPEAERLFALGKIVDRYFPEDVDFLADLDEEDLVNMLYGQLIEEGEDPDEVFAEYGIWNEGGK